MRGVAGIPDRHSSRMVYTDDKNAPYAHLGTNPSSAAAASLARLELRSKTPREGQRDARPRTAGNEPIKVTGADGNSRGPSRFA